MSVVTLPEAMKLPTLGSPSTMSPTKEIVPIFGSASGSVPYMTTLKIRFSLLGSGMIPEPCTMPSVRQSGHSGDFAPAPVAAFQNAVVVNASTAK